MELTRRQILGGIVAVGATGAGAAAGTTALFGDEESFDGNDVVAGELDLEVAWRSRRPDGTVETSSDFPDPSGDADAPIVDLADVKPGDSGRIEFVLRIDDNSGYVSLLGAERADEERGETEPERASSVGEIPVGSEGELDEFVETTVAYGEFDGDRIRPTTPAYTASLASLVALGGVGTGLPLDGARSLPVEDLVLGAAPEPFAGGTLHGLSVDWTLPEAVGNSVQTDRYEFSIGFYAEQARNNRP
jgi:predicted ribosomally synthesized peptide with SipW-like signal peptide